VKRNVTVPVGSVALSSGAGSGKPLAILGCSASIMSDPG